MSDDERTREELLAELRALRARVAELEGARSSGGATPASEPPPQEDSAEHPSRRHLIKWVTPVVLGSAALPRTLYAQGFGTTPAPTPSPTPSA
jgi:hypothetical protein